MPSGTNGQEMTSRGSGISPLLLVVAAGSGEAVKGRASLEVDQWAWL